MLRRQTDKPANPLDAVFATCTCIRSPNLETKWGRLVRGTEFAWVTVHVFRKSVATMIDASVDAKAAAAQLGHSNEAITQQYYIHKSKVAPDVRQYLQGFGPARAGERAHFTQIDAPFANT